MISRAVDGEEGGTNRLSGLALPGIARQDAGFDIRFLSQALYRPGNDGVFGGLKLIRFG